MTITPMRPWLVAMVAAFALSTITVPVAAAGPEGSDSFYLDLLSGLPVNEKYGKQFMVQEGHKICDAIHGGASEDNATDMVQSDLRTSNYEAFRVVGSAELGLGCFSLKVHGM